MVLAAALPVRLQPLPRLPTRSDCRTVDPAAGRASVVTLPPGGALLQASEGVGAALRLRRFASGSFPLRVGTLRGAARLRHPARPVGTALGAAGERQRQGNRVLTVTAIETQAEMATSDAAELADDAHGGSRVSRGWARAWAYARANPMLVGFIVAG